MKDLLMPNLYIVGAPRAGTTSLYHLLDSHPEVCGTRPKEPMFFEHDASIGARGHQFATEHYDDERFILTANTRLCWVKYCAERVKYFSSDAKIFLCIRNPIERFYSHWTFLRNKLTGREHRGFDEVVRASISSFDRDAFWSEAEIIPFSDRYAGYFIDHLLHCGLYADTYRRYARLFGARNVKVIPLPRQGFMKTEIFNFIGINEEKSNYEKRKIDSRWPSVDREPTMTKWQLMAKYPRAYEMLYNFYQPTIDDLSKYIDNKKLYSLEFDL